LLLLNLDLFLLNPFEEKRGGKKFDIIYDYFGFNSIQLGRRDEYVEMWLKMLKDDGYLIGFFCPLTMIRIAHALLTAYPARSLKRDLMG